MTSCPRSLDDHRLTLMPALTLKTKMTLAVSLLVAGIALFIGFVNLFEFERHYKKMIADQQFLLISALADEIDDKLETAQNSLVAVSKLITPDMIRDKQEAQHFIDNRVGISSIFEGGLFLFNSAGFIIAHNTKRSEISNNNYSYSDYFKQTIVTAKPVISELFKVSFAPYNPSVIFTAPIFENPGKVIAMLTGVLDLTQHNFISKLANIKIGESGYLYLFNRYRLMIMHPEKDRVFQTDVPPGVNPLYDAALNGFEGSGETVNSRGVFMLASFKSLKKSGWILAATNPQMQAYAPLVTARKQFYLLLSTVIIGAMALTWLLMKYLTAPLLAVIEHIAKMPLKQGDNRFLRVQTHDEIATLADRFNQMIVELDSQMEIAQHLAAFKKAIEEDDGLEEVYLRLGGVFQQLGLQGSLIYQISDDQRKMRLIYPTRLAYESLRCSDALPGQSDLCQTTCSAPPASSPIFPQVCKKFAGESSSHQHCIPIIAGDSLTGIVRFPVNPLAAQSPEMTRKMAQAEQYIQESLPVIEVKRLLRKLKESALTDPLTGLHNRRFLQEYTENLVASMQRRQKTIGLIMCDLDHFKQVNDQYGHDVGDIVLRETARIIKKSIRDSDLVIRFGGEEFLVVLLDIEAGSAATVGEKIRESVQNTTFKLAKSSLKQTLSLGVSELPQDSDRFWQSIKFADVALYKAKEAGRNCVIQFTKDMQRKEPA